MSLVEDPVGDPRWLELLGRHPAASVFHSPGWLQALKRTYGYEPFVLTTTAEGPLENGLLLCRVRTWAARRLVSLPFSDHCDPLVGRAEHLNILVSHLVNEVKRGGWRAAELRPRSSEARFSEAGPFRPGANYVLHTLDLRPGATEIFKRFHPSSTQRAVRRAEREGLTYEAGTSEGLLACFYGLLRLTRRRHGLPPQPLAWFRNLVACLGDGITIHVANKDARPIAAVLTLSFKRTVTYKYGGSDAAFHRLGAMPFLFWRVIQDAASRGFEALDLGRSDLDQPGLIAFKDHLGATRSTLSYYRYPESGRDTIRPDWVSRAAQKMFASLPDPALDLAGRILYRHLG